MVSRVWIAGLLALALVLPAATAAPPAEPSGSEKIDKLISQLGSNDFAERQKASKELEKIGAEALPALEKAAKDDDAEVHKRAKTLIDRISARQALEPRKVHLVFKDTPLSEAIETFRKQSTYNMQLIDPDGKLKDRTVTLDTGETTFWHALALFCDKAGLVEGTMQDLFQMRPGGVGFPAAPGGIGNAPRGGAVPPGGFAPPGAPAAAPPGGRPQPGQPPQPLPDRDKLKEKPSDDAPPPPRKPVRPQPPAPAANPPAAQIQVQIQPGGPAMAGPPFMMGMTSMAFGSGGPIILKAGKGKQPPADDRSAVRVRVSPHGRNMGGPPRKDVITVALEVNPEPRVEFRGIKEVRINKAVDDQDQHLQTQKDNPPPGLGGPVGGIGGFPGGGAGGPPGGMPMPPMGMMGMMGMSLTQVHLQPGEKQSRSLKELSGVITGRFLAEDKPDVVVKDVLDAASKTFKGDNGTSIKVTEVKDKDNQVTIRFEVQYAGPRLPGRGGIGAPVPPIAVPQPAPAQPAPPAKAPPPGGAPQAALAAAQVQAAQAQPAQGAPPGGAGQAFPRPPFAGPRMGGPGGISFPEGFMGLTLRDDKGKSLPVRMTLQVGGMGNQGPTMAFEMKLDRHKGQGKPSTLVLAPRKKMVELDVPFTLANVDLPRP